MELAPEEKKLLEDKDTFWVMRQGKVVTLALKHSGLKQHMVICKNTYKKEEFAKMAEEYFIKIHKIKKQGRC